MRKLIRNVESIGHCGFFNHITMDTNAYICGALCDKTANSILSFIIRAIEKDTQSVVILTLQW